MLARMRTRDEIIDDVLALLERRHPKGVFYWHSRQMLVPTREELEEDLTGTLRKYWDWCVWSFVRSSERSSSRNTAATYMDQVCSLHHEAMLLER